MSADWTEFWVFKLIHNLLGYATVAVPGALLVYVTKKSKYLNTADNWISRYMRLFVKGSDDVKASTESNSHISSLRNQATWEKAITVIFCFIGLQISYLSWGVLQEKIMTQDYHSSDGEVEKFKNSQFLVFVNRVLAFIFSSVYISFTKQPQHVAPLYKYSFSSFTNIMSSWFQYEALKYVSFPTQVLAKASKIIPVMIMGKIVSKQSYKWHEYVTALAISIGSAIFLLSGKQTSDIVTSTTASGAIMLLAYIICDSFTSNWQSTLFKQYHMTSVQMMCGVNLFSCIFTSVSLLQQGGFTHSFLFLLKFSRFLWDCILLSICSAIGQMFIFFTISQFGPVVFVIMMTIRQILAILLSCILYHHALNAGRILGVIIVFSTIFVRIYLNNRKKLKPVKVIVENDQKI